MQNCEVCGRRFDPYAFQVIVPELGRGFDRIECAESARAAGVPTSGIAAAPLVAIVEPITGVQAPGGYMAALRVAAAAPVGTLGLLAAGAAAAAYLWLRVLGADTTSFPLSRAGAPPAFGHQTVQAHVEQAPSGGGAPAAREPAERPAAAPVTTLLAVSGPPAPASVPRKRHEPRPSAAPAPAAAPTPSAPIPSRSGEPSRAEPSAPVKATGKGHPKRGKGHFKHGEEDGIHTPGQHRPGGHGHGHGQGHGHAHGHGH